MALWAAKLTIAFSKTVQVKLMEPQLALMAKVGILTAKCLKTACARIQVKISYSSKHDSCRRKDPQTTKKTMPEPSCIEV